MAAGCETFGPRELQIRFCVLTKLLARLVKAKAQRLQNQSRRAGGSCRARSLASTRSSSETQAGVRILHAPSVDDQQSNVAAMSTPFEGGGRVPLRRNHNQSPRSRMRLSQRRSLFSWRSGPQATEECTTSSRTILDASFFELGRAYRARPLSPRFAPALAVINTSK